MIRQKAVAMMTRVDLENETKQTTLRAEVISTATILINYIVKKPNEFESSYVCRLTCIGW